MVGRFECGKTFDWRVLIELSDDCVLIMEDYNDVKNMRLTDRKDSVKTDGLDQPL